MSTVPLTASKTAPFTPPSMRPKEEGAEPSVIFYLRVPTYEDRDLIGVRMYRMGVREVSIDQIRATMISELFEIKSEEEADADARWLEDFWARSQREAAEMAAWRYQEDQRAIDEAEGAPKREPTPEPKPLTTPRDRARATLLSGEIVDQSQRVRDKLADQNQYDSRFKLLSVRMQVAGWTGLETKARFEEVLGQEVLTRDCVEELRRELAELGVFRAYEELADEINASFDLTAGLEKNSDSPPESTSPPTGSSSSNSGSATTDGSSTASSTGPTPEAGSPKTSGTSSGSSRGSGSGRTKSGPTDGK